MPTLHGFSYSNYYNMPKHALLYKGVPFEEDLVYPSAKDYDQLSPALKVPSLTTDEGQHLSEASVLCEYIEETYPDKPLLPTTRHCSKQKSTVDAHDRVVFRTAQPAITAF